MAPSTRSNRVRALEAENQSMAREIAQLRARDLQQAQLIQRYEDVHGQLFTCFPRLPSELRQRIWQLSASPRFVEVYDIYGYFDIDFRLTNNHLCKWAADCETRAPVISQVCRESRDVFLREYFIVAPEIFKFPDPEGPERWELDEIDKPGPPIYLNPAIDTVYFDRETDSDLCFYLSNLALQMDLSIATQKKARNGRTPWAVRNLALGDQWLRWFEEQPRDLDAFDRTFGKLHELVFLAKFGSESRFVKQFIVQPPESEIHFEVWERAMARVGWLKAWVKEGDWKYAGWAALRVSVSTMVNRKSCTIDGRGGYNMFGPANK